MVLIEEYNKKYEFFERFELIYEISREATPNNKIQLADNKNEKDSVSSWFLCQRSMCAGYGITRRF